MGSFPPWFCSAFLAVSFLGGGNAVCNRRQSPQVSSRAPALPQWLPVIWEYELNRRWFGECFTTATERKNKEQYYLGIQLEMTARWIVSGLFCFYNLLEKEGKWPTLGDLENKEKEQKTWLRGWGHFLGKPGGLSSSSGTYTEMRGMHCLLSCLLQTHHGTHTHTWWVHTCTGTCKQFLSN